MGTHLCDTDRRTGEPCIVPPSRSTVNGCTCVDLSSLNSYEKRVDARDCMIAGSHSSGLSFRKTQQTNKGLQVATSVFEQVSHF